MGIAQASGPLLALARVGGVLLISLVVMTIGFSIPPIIRSINERAMTLHPFVPVAVAMTVVLIAVVSPAGRDIDGGDLRVAAVQGGGRQGTSALEVPSREVTAAHLEATASIEADTDLDLVIWPENAIDVNRVPFGESEQAAAIAAEASRLGVPFLVGVTEDAEYVYDVDPGNFVNAQYTVMPDGSVVDRYVKVVRVPYGEYVPLRGVLEALGAPVDQIPSDALAGRGPAVLEVPGVARTAVVISWEVFFGRRTRDGVTSGGELLVNPTNGASYTWTILQTQQVASSRLRAVETGRWVIQVAPTGFSAIIDPDGRVLQRSDISEQRVLTADVMRRTGLTWYSRLGDTWVIALAIGMVAVPTFRRQRSRSPDRH
jgi:apolipoprotein N-acyltransferase